MKKRFISLLLAAALFVSVAAGQAGAVVWTMPAGRAPGPTGQGNINVQGLLSHGGQQYVGTSTIAMIGTPSAPTVTQNGTVGATSLVYACIAFDVNQNQSIPSATTTITNGNATLTAVNNVSISCGGQQGALGYLIAKVDTSHIVGYCYAKTNTSCTFIDDGTVGTTFTYTPQTVDQTGGQSCAGQVTLTAGNAVVTAPCISNINWCSASSAIGTSAGAAANGAVACKPTSTATVINSATVTVGAVSVSSAATPATSPIVNWWAGPK